MNEQVARLLALLSSASCAPADLETLVASALSQAGVSATQVRQAAAILRQSLAGE